MTDTVLYLASKSPRRAELLHRIGVTFEPLRVDVEETVHANEDPVDYVRRVAEEKAWAGIAVRGHSLPVLGADTEVVLDGEVLGKPENRDHAMDMLSRLSNRSHRVLSAVAVADGDTCHLALSESVVTFREILPAEAKSYWSTGEAADKAGAYAIQGIGAVFVKHLEGSHSGVMGLPLYETARLLERYGIRVL